MFQMCNGLFVIDVMQIWAFSGTPIPPVTYALCTCVTKLLIPLPPIYVTSFIHVPLYNCRFLVPAVQM